MPCRQPFSNTVDGVGGAGSVPDYCSPTHAHKWDDGDDHPQPFVGTRALVRHLAVRLEVAPGAGNSWTFDLLKNGATTVYTLTVSDSDTFAEISDCLLLEFGDTIILRRTPTSGPTVPAWVKTTLVWDMQTPYESYYGGLGQMLFTSAQVQATSPFSPYFWGAALTPASGGINNVVPNVPGVITTYRITTKTNVPANATFMLQKNGQNFDGTVGTPDSRVTLLAGTNEATWTGMIPLGAGDQLCLKQTTASGLAAIQAGFGMLFKANSDAKSIVATAHYINMPNAAGTYWARPTPTTQQAWQGSTEAYEEIVNDSPYAFAVLGLWARIGGLFGGGVTNRVTFSHRQNHASPAGAPTVVINPGSLNGEDTTNELAIGPGDRWVIRNVQEGATGLARLATFSSGIEAAAELWGDCYPNPNPSDEEPPIEPPVEVPTGDCECCVQTKLDILNLALLRIGVSKTIVDLSEQTRERLTGDLIYDQERRACLREFPWNFATKYARAEDNVSGYMNLIFGTASDPYNEDWQYAYRYPVDCIFARRILGDLMREHEPNPPTFKVGRLWNFGSEPEDDVLALFTNREDAILEYTADVDCALDFQDALFMDALAWRCAVALAPSLARDPRTAIVARQMYEEIINQARAVNAREQQHAKPGPAEHITARGGARNRDWRRPIQ